MSMYEENGINNYIKNNNIEGFSFYENSQSLLVIYDTFKCEPLLVVLDKRYEDEASIENPDEYENNLNAFALDIAKKLNVHLMSVKYLNSYTTFDNSSKIRIRTDEKKDNIIRSGNDNDLFKVIKRLVGEKTTIRKYNNSKNPAKKENDALSSAFHLWTRKNVGIGAFVDIDLARINNGRITELIELKRSFFKLENWKPFNNDINNYAILADISKRLDVPLYVTYNRQSNSKLYGIEDKYQIETIKQNTGDIVYDIIDKIAVFKIESRDIGFMNNVGAASRLGTCKLDDFLSASDTADLFD